MGDKLLFICKHHKECDGRYSTWDDEYKQCSYQFTFQPEHIKFNSWVRRSLNQDLNAKFRNTRWFRLPCPKAYSNGIAVRWKEE